MTNAIELTTSTYVIRSATLRHHLDEEGKPWFIAKDVCDFLELANPSDAYTRVWPEYKGVALADTPGGEQTMITVSEAGLYQLIFTSHKPEAIAFQRWVFEELLPTLRRQGFYQLRGRDVLPALGQARGTPGGLGKPGHGRQPILDVLKARGVSQQKAWEALNELPLEGVPQVTRGSFGNQCYGGCRVGEPLARRASAWLNLPAAELFTSLRG